jgi:hypothetical protein
VATRGTGALLARLHRLNLTTVFLLAAVVVLAGLAMPGVVGGAILLLLFAALAALLALTWVHTPPRLVLVRVLILTGLLVIAIMKLT